MPRDFLSPPTNSSFQMDIATMFLRLDPQKNPPKPQNPKPKTPNNNNHNNNNTTH
jgi:hypothetical protein